MAAYSGCLYTHLRTSDYGGSRGDGCGVGDDESRRVGENSTQFLSGSPVIMGDWWGCVVFALKLSTIIIIINMRADRNILRSRVFPGKSATPRVHLRRRRVLI